jgi:hypothetical protein
MSSPKDPSLAIEYFKEAIAYQISADRLYEQIDSQIRHSKSSRYVIRYTSSITMPPSWLLKRAYYRTICR